MYYIKEIKLLSDVDTTSVLSLENGLNIVYGPSNTGKSLILDCIDFMFGGEARRLYKKELKLRNVAIRIVHDGKEISLSRALYKKNKKGEVKPNNIIVIIGDEKYTGSFSTGKGSKKTPPLYKFWLHIMGIEDGVKIIADMEFTPNNLTVRTFIHTFLINETRMVGENSILKNGQGYTKNIPVSTIMSLIYLATGNTFLKDGFTPETKGTVLREKRAAARRLVDLSIHALREEKVTSLDAPKDGRTVKELQDTIEELMEEISGAENALDNASAKSSELARDLVETDKLISESEVLKNRYDALRTQYEADIQRLTFIAEGDMHSDLLPQIEHCPFCNGELDKEKSESCVEAAIAEVSKIEKKIKDLKQADINILSEIQVLRKKRLAIIEQRKDIQSCIRAELQPRVNRLRNEFLEYSAALEHAKAAELVDTFNRILNEQLEVINSENQEEENSLRFNVRAKINEFLKEPFNRYLAQTLSECKYENLTGSRFDENICDVVVGGSEKMSQGKGFRAFLNTVLALVVQETLHEYNMFQPHLLVLDSPILSLKEREETTGTEVTTDGMRSGLFKYMISHEENRQTIILENEIPNIDYSGVHMIHFTKKEGDEMYGLIKGYRD